MRANTSIARKERQTVTLTDFRGVDLTTSPLRVAKNRATYMRNLINDHGINHKRPGWSEMLRIDGAKINGIFPYQNGDHDVLLIHAGTAFYRATYNEATGLWSAEQISKEGWGLTDTRSQCVYRGGVAYILGCGNYLAYGKHDDKKYSLVPVSEIAYVPTTTVSINEGDPASDARRATLESVNLLTSKRINKLLGTEKGSNAERASWTLDASIDEESEVVIELTHKCTSPTNDTGTYEVVLKNKNGGRELYCVKSEQIYGNMAGGACYIEGSSLASGYINFSEGIIEMISPTTPPLADVENIRVTFSHTTDGYKDRIHKAKYGVLFGTNGASNRLFVGGNPDHPDMDFWSEYDDFTYFPDGNTMVIGGDQRPVTGYARLSDSTLAIFKESLVGEPSIYYRTGKTTTQIDADGDTIPADYFPVTAGTAGEGSVSHHAVANLGGDVLILSPEGVRGIELSANVSSGERYTRDRGRAIYEDLRKKNLAEAVATVWRGRYFLACGDGVCYVADSRYRATFEGSPDTGYEWWVWDNVPARVFAVYKDRLLFGDADGKVCGFVEGTFADRECLALESGSVLGDKGGTLNYADDLNWEVGDRVVLTGGACALLATVRSVTDGTCYADVSQLYDGQKVYIDTVENSGLSEGTPYTVTEVDVVSECFRLENEAGDTITPLSDGFRLLESVDGEELYVADASDPATLARGYATNEDGERVWNTVFLTTYGGITKSWTGRYMRVYPVKAEWVTPVMDLGTNLYSKSLLSITVATEPGVDGAVTFGYETRRVLRHLEAGRALAVSTEEGATVVGGGEGFSFGDIDFNQFSFDTAFACSYTRRMHLRNFNFITFRFGSECERDCAVSSAVAVYKINRQNRGVR